MQRYHNLTKAQAVTAVWKTWWTNQCSGHPVGGTCSVWAWSRPCGAHCSAWFCCRMQHDLLSGHTLGVPLGRCCTGCARSYYWVWFSSVCELGVVSCGLSLVLVLSVITSSFIVLALLQFCCSKILKHFFASYRDLRKAMLGFWFVLCYFLVGCRR